MFYADALVIFNEIALVPAITKLLMLLFMLFMMHCSESLQIEEQLINI